MIKYGELFPQDFEEPIRAAIETSRLGAAIAISEADGEISDLRISGLDELTVRKDVVTPLVWTIEHALSVDKTQVEVSIEVWSK